MNIYSVQGLNAINESFSQTVKAENFVDACHAADKLADKYELVSYNVTFEKVVRPRHIHSLQHQAI